MVDSARPKELCLVAKSKVGSNQPALPLYLTQQQIAHLYKKAPKTALKISNVKVVNILCSMIIMVKIMRVQTTNVVCLLKGFLFNTI